MVVVVDGNQVAELQVTGHGGGLTGNTLHSTAITEEAVGVVVEKLEIGLVEDTTGVSLGNGQTNSVGETLTEGTGGHLNTGGVMGLGVAGGDAVELLGKISTRLFLGMEFWKTYTESLKVIQSELVTEEVEQRVLQQAAVAVTVRSSWLEGLVLIEGYFAARGRKMCFRGRRRWRVAHTTERNDHGWPSQGS